ncbi:hypothetical protein Tco_1532620 [Tanacetum coccineum]
MAAGGGGSGGGDKVEMVVRVLVKMAMAHGGEDDNVMRVASVVMVVYLPLKGIPSRDSILVNLLCDQEKI